MRGMDALEDLRMNRRKPRMVMVELVTRFDEGAGLQSTGVVSVQIGPDEHLGDLDLRPLVGCRVAVHDYADDPDRHLELFDLIAEAKPATVWAAFSGGEVFTLHTRRAPNYDTEEVKA